MSVIFSVISVGVAARQVVYDLLELDTARVVSLLPRIHERGGTEGHARIELAHESGECDRCQALGPAFARCYRSLHEGRCPGGFLLPRGSHVWHVCDYGHGSTAGEWAFRTGAAGYHVCEFATYGSGGSQREVASPAEVSEPDDE